MELRTAGYSTLLFRHRNFALLFVSQVFAYLAIWTANIVMLHVVYAAMDSSLGPALVLIAQILPAFFLMPVASHILDRYDRRRVILATTVSNGALALVMASCLAALPVAWLFALFILYSASVTTFVIASSALLPMVVGQADLSRANCLIQATPCVMLVLSGAAVSADGLTGLGAQGELVVVAATFFASAAVLGKTGSLRSLPQAGASRESGYWFPSFIGGLCYLFRNRELARVFAIRMTIYVGVGGQVLLSIFSEEFFKLGESGTGLLYMARGLGMLVGGLGLVHLVLAKGLRPTDAIGIGLALFGLGYLIASAVSGFGIGAVALLLGLGFVGEGLLKPMTMALLQKHCDPQYLARVVSAEQGLSSAVQSAVALIIAACLSTGSPSTVLWVSAVVGALLVVASLAWVAITRVGVPQLLRFQ